VPAVCWSWVCLHSHTQTHTHTHTYTYTCCFRCLPPLRRVHQRESAATERIVTMPTFDTKTRARGGARRLISSVFLVPFFLLRVCFVFWSTELRASNNRGNVDISFPSYRPSNTSKHTEETKKTENLSDRYTEKEHETPPQNREN
jgi:hypothetical protein